MTKLVTHKCPGCPGSCPVVAIGDPKDAINFSMQYDCLADATVKPRQWTAEELLREGERMLQEQTRYRPAEHQPYRKPPNYDQSYGLPQVRNHIAEREELQRLREQEIEEDAERTMTRFLMDYPHLEPVWQAYRHRVREHVAGSALRETVRLIIGVARTTDVRKEMQDRFDHQHAELVDLCQRLVKAFDSARDVIDMQAAIEELDSMLYEMDKGSDG